MYRMGVGWIWGWGWGWVILHNISIIICRHLVSREVALGITVPAHVLGLSNHSTVEALA